MVDTVGPAVVAVKHRDGRGQVIGILQRFEVLVLLRFSIFEAFSGVVWSDGLQAFKV